MLPASVSNGMRLRRVVSRVPEALAAGSPACRMAPSRSVCLSVLHLRSREVTPKCILPAFSQKRSMDRAEHQAHAGCPRLQGRGPCRGGPVSSPSCPGQRGGDRGGLIFSSHLGPCSSELVLFVNRPLTRESSYCTDFEDPASQRPSALPCPRKAAPEVWTGHPLCQKTRGTSLVAQCIRLCAPNAGGLGLIPGQGTRSHMHAATKSSHVTTKEPACLN